MLFLDCTLCFSRIFRQLLLFLLLLDDIVVSSVVLPFNPFSLCLSLSTVLLLLWFLSLLVCPFRSGSLGVALVAARTREHSLARRIFPESKSCGNILGFSLAFLPFLCISVICLRPPALVHTCVRFAKRLQRLLHFCCFGSFSFEAFVVSCSAGSFSLPADRIVKVDVRIPSRSRW